MEDVVDGAQIEGCDWFGSVWFACCICLVGKKYGGCGSNETGGRKIARIFENST